MSHNDLPIHEIYERAAQWAARLHENGLGDDEMSEAERTELHRWLLADRRHAAEFKAHNALLALAAEFPWKLYAGLKPYRSREKRISMRWPAKLWPVAAALAVAATGLAVWLATSSRGEAFDSYATRTGEMRTVTFADGSLAHLNTRTRLQWQSDRHSRRVRFIDGEALFEVVPDAEKPFIVAVDRSEIRALGTRFNIYRKTSGQVAVTVLEGTIDIRQSDPTTGDVVWARRLQSSQGISYASEGITEDAHPTDEQRAVQWRSGMMAFHNESLVTVLEELSRYTDERIIVRDPRLASLWLGGVVTLKSTDVHNALDRMSRVGPMSVSYAPGRILLDYVADPNSGNPNLNCCTPR